MQTRTLDRLESCLHVGKGHLVPVKHRARGSDANNPMSLPARSLLLLTVLPSKKGSAWLSP